MKKKRIMASFPIRILAVSIPGLLAGLFLNATRTMGLTSGALNLVVTARYVLSQIITFLAPLIIIGLVASSIISVKKAPTPVTAPNCPDHLFFHAWSRSFRIRSWISDHSKTSGIHRQFIFPLPAGYLV